MIVTKRSKCLLGLLNTHVPTVSTELGPDLPDSLCWVQLQTKMTALLIFLIQRVVLMVYVVDM